MAISDVQISFSVNQITEQSRPQHLEPLFSEQSLLYTKVEVLHQKNVRDLLSAVQTHGVVQHDNQYNNVARPKFVIAQACMEYNLLQKLPNDVMCVVHTDTPTTPLCADDGIGIEALISVQAKDEAGTRYSVEIRKPIVHELCKRCTESNPYYVVYKQSREAAAASKKYTTEALKGNAISQARDLDKYFDKNKSDEHYHIHTLTNQKITPELSGASYFYKDDEKWRYFGISAQQAKDASNSMSWKMWDVPVNSQKGKELVETYKDVLPDPVMKKIFQN